MKAKYENKQEIKGKLVVKLIRIVMFAIILIAFMCEVCDAIKRYDDTIKSRIILYNTLPIILIAYILLIVILARNPRLAAMRVTVLDILSIVMLIILFAILREQSVALTEIEDTFKGNNAHAFFYSGGIGGKKGYDNMESLVEEMKDKLGNSGEVEEIYRIQEGEKIFVYFKVGEEEIVEYDFYKQGDLYYCIGDMRVLYNSIACSDSYTAEDTIRKDIAMTMWREGQRLVEGAPAWGVSADERIFSMTINSEDVAYAVQVNEVDGKKYYFWIVADSGGIESSNDVITAEIQMDAD